MRQKKYRKNGIANKYNHEMKEEDNLEHLTMVIVFLRQK